MTNQDEEQELHEYLIEEGVSDVQIENAIDLIDAVLGQVK